tara:strand:+ start:8101 stop:9069 length:969 start_codon:yes stop_codon:yes gene_type:complete
LERVLNNIPKFEHPDLLVGLNTNDDASVYRIGNGLALVQSADFFPPIVDDPYEFGMIAAANALSDIYAMGGKPLTALNLVAFPEHLDPGILAEILQGGAQKIQESGAVLAGGHTIKDDEPKYGLAVTGIVGDTSYVTNAGSLPGDRLVLTKPIGTGIMTTAAKQQLIHRKELEPTVNIMSELNNVAAQIMLDFNPHACTDITGYGLVGHAAEMAKASNVTAKIYSASVPKIDGCLDYVRKGVIPGGTENNRIASIDYTLWPQDMSTDNQTLLCDAQTSGGLLISVRADLADQLVAKLASAGVPQSTVIGEITPKSHHVIEII